MADTNRIRDLDSASDAVQNAATAGRQALEEGYETVREYGEKSLDYVGQLGGGLTDFVKREPLLAVGAAFLVGYLAAQLLRRTS
jgi:hypothetical protein